MAQITNFFLGANSGSGFQNLFSEIMDPETAFDIMILKGGPGVGKNTFMREIGRTMEQAGADVEYLWCSGDPDSLDGVVIPALRCAVCDGTSPHVVEPKYPAAVDRYVDLGRFYDLPAAKAQAGEVKRHTHDYQDAYGRAYRCLKAARQVELDTVAEVSRSFDRQRAARRFSGIMARELRPRSGGQKGRVKQRFLGAVTHKGVLCLYDTAFAQCSRVYELADRDGLAHELLIHLLAGAVEGGYDAVACPDPMAPSRLAHLLVPQRGLAFVSTAGETALPRPADRRIHLDGAAEGDVLRRDRPRLRFARKVSAALMGEAVASLSQAKAMHDRLEALYNPYVDFDLVEETARQIGDEILNG